MITQTQLDFYVQRTIFSLSGGRLFSQEQLIDLSLIFLCPLTKSSEMIKNRLNKGKEKKKC